MEKTRIVLADDHQMFLDGLIALLAQIGGTEVVAAVNDGVQLLEVLGRVKADLVITDLHMPASGGLEATRKIREHYPSVRVLGLTMDDEPENIQEMLEAGASGYILKNTGKLELEMAIRQVMAGGTYLSLSLSNQLAQRLLLQKKAIVERMGELEMLTGREIEILKMIALEHSNAEIAEKLFISPKTVETHRKNLMKKIGVRNSLGVYKFAQKYKLI